MNEPAPCIELTIVIPAYNESQRLPAMLTRLLEGFASGAFSHLTTQVLVVDDGSNDDTANVARSYLRDLPWADVVRMPANRGKGAAVRAGVVRARGEKLVFIDADMSIDPYSIPTLVTSLDHADIAVGSRAHPQSCDDGPLVSRNVAGKLFNIAVRRATGLDILDTQCGFKGFNTRVAKLLFHLSTIDRYSFDVEILWMARALGMTIAEVPITWKHVPGSHVHALSDGCSMLLDIHRALSQPPLSRGVPIITVWPPREAHSRLSTAKPAGSGGGASGGAVAGNAAWVETVKQTVRASNLAIPWQGGAEIIMPLSSAPERHAMITSLVHRLPGIECEESWATVGSLVQSGIIWPTRKLSTPSPQFITETPT